MSRFNETLPVTDDSDSNSSEGSVDSNGPILAPKKSRKLIPRGYFGYSPPRSPRSITRFRRFRESRHIRRFSFCFLILIFLATYAIIVWLSLSLTVVNRLQIPAPSNVLDTIVKGYTPPNSTHEVSPAWLPDFSAGVKPIPCHSHNDYVHRVPLYEGLAAGCISTEADIWATERNGSIDLLVGHHKRALTNERTLENLYLDPLVTILDQQNALLRNTSVLGNNSTVESTSPVGVFSEEPYTSLILILDFKTRTPETWTAVLEKLKPLQAKDYLTYWTPSTGITHRPLTIVASGDAPFTTLNSNTTYRNIFYDAPIVSLSDSNTPYNSNNSYYASSSLGNAIGTVLFGHVSAGQKDKVSAQTKRAAELGLKSRYWATPAWPVSWRNRIWEALIKAGEEVLNVDDLLAVSRWDWNMCVIGGLVMCDG